MNIFTVIFLICAIIAFADKALGAKLGLGESIDVGMSTMGATTMAILGISSVGIAFVGRHAEQIEMLADVLPFAPSMIIGTCLCPEMGAFALTRQMTNEPEMVVFNGVIIAGILGQTISFQFPVFMAYLDRDYHSVVIKGFIIGITMIPFGLILGALMLGLSVTDFVSEFIPVLIMCLLLGIGMIKAQTATVKIVSGIAKIIQIIIYLPLIIVLIGVFVPFFEYAEDSHVYDAMIVILKCTIIICGALSLSDVFIRVFGKQLSCIAKRLGVNEVSVMAFILNPVNSLAILPLYRKMDEKGRLMNSAFSVSGAYFLGGQMGFVSSAVNDGYFLMAFISAKVLCGLLSMFTAYKLYPYFTEVMLGKKENSTEEPE